LATACELSRLTPGSSGSWPLRFDQLVQPVLDHHCVACHTPDGRNAQAAKFNLTSTNAWKALLTFGGEDLKKKQHLRARPLLRGPRHGREQPALETLTDPKGHPTRSSTPTRNRFATRMDTYAQRTGHYSEEQENKLVKFRERLSVMGQ
jgi:hypothetical protein